MHAIASRAAIHTRLTKFLPPGQRTPDFLQIEFLIVGGAITGLSAAIALSRVGHKVTVLDTLPSFSDVSKAPREDNVYAD